MVAKVKRILNVDTKVSAAPVKGSGVMDQVVVV